MSASCAAVVRRYPSFSGPTGSEACFITAGSVARKANTLVITSREKPQRLANLMQRRMVGSSSSAVAGEQLSAITFNVSPPEPQARVSRYRYFPQCENTAVPPADHLSPALARVPSMAPSGGAGALPAPVG